MSELKKKIINKILKDLPQKSERSIMTDEEWYGWFEEVYDKAQKESSEKIEKLEKEVSSYQQSYMELSRLNQMQERQDDWLSSYSISRRIRPEHSSCIRGLDWDHLGMELYVTYGDRYEFGYPDRVVRISDTELVSLLTQQPITDEDKVVLFEREYFNILKEEENKEKPAPVWNEKDLV